MLWTLLYLTVGQALADLPRRAAVVIGVDAYEDEAIPDLRFAANDARRVAETLLESGSFVPEDVALMTPDQPNAALRPSRQNVLAAVGAAATEPVDALFVYFSGHGSAENTPGAGRQNLIFPMDTRREDLGATGLSVAELLALVDQAHASQRVVVLDACRSELAVGDKGLTRAFAPPTWTYASGTQVLYSTRFGDYAYEDQAAGLSRMTRYLVEALSGAADGLVRDAQDGVVSTAEIYQYLLRQMEAYDRAAGVQIPVQGGEATDLPLVQVPRYVRGGRCDGGEEAAWRHVSAARATLLAGDGAEAWREVGWAKCAARGASVLLSEELARELHRLDAILAEQQGDLARAARAQAAVEGAETCGALPTEVVPGARWYVDGTRREHLPVACPAWVQLRWRDGSVHDTTLFEPGGARPSWEIPPRRVQLRPVAVGLGAASVGLALGGGALLGAGELSWQDLEADALEVQRGSASEIPDREARLERTSSFYRAGWSAEAAAAVLGVATFGLVWTF